MGFDTLTHKNALMYALHEYDNPQCLSMAEFNEDYKRFKYIKRLCRRYMTTTRLSERLMLNHMLLLTNVFGPTATVRLLFLKCDDANMFAVLKPFLSYLDVLPDIVHGINGKNILTAAIPTDHKLVRRLEEAI